MIKVNNLIKFYMILLLSKPKYGYELIKDLEQKLERKISASQIYPFLKTLEREKLIKFEKIEQREKKRYKLTKKGKKFVHNLLKRFGDFINIAIKPKLTICAHCGCKVYEGGHKEKIKGGMLKFCCHHCAKSYKEHV